MLFVRFPDAEIKEATEDLYKRLVPNAVEFFRKSSYGQLELKVDARHRWLDMDHASTWYPAERKSYVPEAIEKIDLDAAIPGRPEGRPGQPRNRRLSTFPGSNIRSTG